MNNLKDRDVIMIASAPWETGGRLNCHHVARRLTDEGCRVLFVESTGLRTPKLTHPQDLLRIIGRLKSIFSKLFGRRTNPPQENLFIMSPLAIPIQGNRLIARVNGRLLARSCRRAAKALELRNPLLWVFLPTGASLPGRMDESALIYHCVDYYAGNPGVNRRLVEELEGQLIESADICFATSRPLADRLKNMGGKVAYMPNVAETERFSNSSGHIPEDIKKLARPVIGYIGNAAAYKIDIELICGIADQRPDWSIAIVGPRGAGDPSTKLDALENRKNIHLLGSKAYELIPEYMHSFDVCIIPFRRSAVTDASFPLKTFEYLAAGKPVVSVPLESLVAEALDNVVKYAVGSDGFIHRIEEALSEAGDEALVAARKSKAAEYSWDKRFREMISIICDILERKEKIN